MTLIYDGRPDKTIPFTWCAYEHVSDKDYQPTPAEVVQARGLEGSSWDLLRMAGKISGRGPGETAESWDNSPFNPKWSWK